jgi:N-acetylneuraminic acid mutarotase
LYGSSIALWGAPSADIELYNTATQTWSIFTTPTVPKLRRNHAATVIGSKMYIFGGILEDNTTVVNDLWAFDFLAVQWTKLLPSGTAPSTRGGHSMVHYSHNGVDYLVVFGGGEPRTKRSFNDLRAYNLNTNSWEDWTPKSSTQPSPRHFHGASIVGNFFFIFGGSGISENLNDLWSLDLSTQPLRWVEIITPPRKASPPGRNSAVFVSGIVWFFSPFFLYIFPFCIINIFFSRNRCWISCSSCLWWI